MDNPYDQNDQDFDFDHRFNSNHYATGNWKLSYLVSRLDGQNYEDIELMIDRGVNADKSGEGVWILDGDPWGYLHTIDVTATKNKLQNLGFNYLYDTGDSCITTSNYPVIGYTSQGLHTGENYPHWPRLDSGYVHNQLQFQYLNGAIFMTFESFNYISNYSVYGRDKHGLLAEFVTRRPSENWAGTGGTGHTWEPYQSGAVKNQYYFPAYAMGYSIVDAAYLGMPYIGWQNIVVGDPLTTIAWGKQAITDNLTLTGTNLVTGEITVPLVNSITIDDGAVLNFKHNGFITGDGYIYTVSSNYSLLINDWQKALFRSEEDNHPKLIWGAYPGIPSLIEGYKIYRKWESSNFELISLVDISTLEFIDEDYEIYNPEANENQKEAEYYITAIIENESSIVESDPSNVIDYWVNKAGKKGTSNMAELNYTIDQNYPNPFNPITQIKYSIKENGLISIRVFDVLGKEVAVLIKEEQPAGEHSVNFDGGNLSSGIYFYTITAKDFHQTKKMLLVK